MIATGEGSLPGLQMTPLISATGREGLRKSGGQLFSYKGTIITCGLSVHMDLGGNTSQVLLTGGALL